MPDLNDLPDRWPTEDPDAEGVSSLFDDIVIETDENEEED